MRGFTTGLLILIGAVLTIPASIAVWEQRVLTNREEFIKVGQDVLAEPAVQDRLTERVSEEITELARANNIEMPGPITGAIARNQITNLTREVVESLPDSLIGRQVLIATHEAVLTAIDNDRDIVTSSSDEIRINLQPALETIIDAISIIVPPLRGIELTGETGQFVIVQEEDAAIAFRAMRWFDGAAWYIAAVPVVVFALAVLIAPSRPIALALIGAAIIVAAGLRILFYEGPLRTLITDGVSEGRPELQPAATAVYDQIAASIVSQEMLIIVAGIGIAVFGVAVLGLKKVSGY